jgi:hypothetical protein
MRKLKLIGVLLRNPGRAHPQDRGARCGRSSQASFEAGVKNLRDGDAIKLSDYAGAILAASVHAGRHEPPLAVVAFKL